MGKNEGDEIYRPTGETIDTVLSVEKSDYSVGILGRGMDVIWVGFDGETLCEPGGCVVPGGGRRWSGRRIFPGVVGEVIENA